ncbi:MAG: glycine cleavage system protein H, partial [Bacteroidia bacterium]|nr:glycine cleavage system protein H [Bacteroidia bacterium]
ESVNQDPYGKGWLVRVDVGSNPDISGLLKADAYQASLNL